MFGRAVSFLLIKLNYTKVKNMSNRAEIEEGTGKTNYQVYDGINRLRKLNRVEKVRFTHGKKWRGPFSSYALFGDLGARLVAYLIGEEIFLGEKVAQHPPTDSKAWNTRNYRLKQILPEEAYEIAYSYSP